MPQPTAPKPDYFSPKEVARQFGVSPETVRKACREGVMAAAVVGIQYRISGPAIRDYLRSRTPNPPPCPTCEDCCFLPDEDDPTDLVPCPDCNLGQRRARKEVTINCPICKGTANGCHTGRGTADYEFVCPTCTVVSLAE